LITQEKYPTLLTTMMNKPRKRQRNKPSFERSLESIPAIRRADRFKNPLADLISTQVHPPTPASILKQHCPHLAIPFHRASFEKYASGLYILNMRWIAPSETSSRTRDVRQLIETAQDLQNSWKLSLKERVSGSSRKKFHLLA
jgi:hypothetical protein